jgi:hypothetical protein
MAARALVLSLVVLTLPPPQKKNIEEEDWQFCDSLLYTNRSSSTHYVMYAHSEGRTRATTITL